ncbi:hypothetical protein VNI00_006466 [Paramarasmius palmivorus]|uniref:Uncharacterized protein n=1 Tax=Paramarasmius palmivorus TaxID=297713 RepID=A0AAW0D5G6_9AGAR
MSQFTIVSSPLTSPAPSFAQLDSDFDNFEEEVDELDETPEPDEARPSSPWTAESVLDADLEDLAPLEADATEYLASSLAVRKSLSRIRLEDYLPCRACSEDDLEGDLVAAAFADVDQNVVEAKIAEGRNYDDNSEGSSEGLAQRVEDWRKTTSATSHLPSPDADTPPRRRAQKKPVVQSQSIPGRARNGEPARSSTIGELAPVLSAKEQPSLRRSTRTRKAASPSKEPSTSAIRSNEGDTPTVSRRSSKRKAAPGPVTTSISPKPQNKSREKPTRRSARSASTTTPASAKLKEMTLKAKPVRKEQLVAVSTSNGVSKKRKTRGSADDESTGVVVGRKRQKRKHEPEVVKGPRRGMRERKMPNRYRAS